MARVRVVDVDIPAVRETILSRDGTLAKVRLLFRHLSGDRCSRHDPGTTGPAPDCLTGLGLSARG